jgi:hypothetical protein
MAATIRRQFEGQELVLVSGMTCGPTLIILREDFTSENLLHKIRYLRQVRIFQKNKNCGYSHLTIPPFSDYYESERRKNGDDQINC